MDRDHLEMMLNLSIDEAWEEGVEEFLDSFEDKGLDSLSEFLERVENKFSIMYDKYLDLVQERENEASWTEHWERVAMQEHDSLMVIENRRM